MRNDPAETLRRVRRWDAARRWALPRIASAPFALSRPERLADGMTILGAIKLQATPRSVADVRSYLSGLLADGPADVTTVVLLASEIATNSMRHTAAGTDGTIALAVLAIGDAIRVEVANSGAPCFGRPHIA